MAEQQPEYASALGELVELDSLSEDPAAFRDGVASAVEHKRKAMQRGQWYLRWQDKQTTVRKQAEKITGILQMLFSTLGPVASSIAPIHADLPIAAAAALLPLATNVVTQQKTCLEGLEKICTLISQYEIMENMYSAHQNISMRNTFNKALINLYTKILEYQVKAASSFKPNAFRQMLKDIIAIDDWKSALNEINKLDTVCKDFGELCDKQDPRSDNKMLRDELGAHQKKLESTLAIAGLQVSKINRIRDWLSPVIAKMDHQNAKKALGEQYQRRGKWGFERKEYLTWDKADVPHCLWIQATGSFSNSTRTLPALI